MSLLAVVTRFLSLAPLSKGRVPIGWVELPLRYAESVYPSLAKGKAQKYWKRVPTGKFRVKKDGSQGAAIYRYFYKPVPTGAGSVHHEDHFVVGAGFRADGGHWHVESVNGDRLTIKHDETNEVLHTTKAELKAKLLNEHRAALEVETKRREGVKTREVEEVKQFGSKAQKERMGVVGPKVELDAGHPSDGNLRPNPGTYTVFRSGPLQTKRGAPFFADTMAGAAAYSSMHGSSPKAYSVTVKNPASFPNQYAALADVTGKSLEEVYRSRDRTSKTNSDWLRDADLKIATELRKRGHDAIVYTKPMPPAKMEMAWLGDVSAISDARNPLRVPEATKDSMLLMHWKSLVSDHAHAKSRKSSREPMNGDWFRSDRVNDYLHRAYSAGEPAKMAADSVHAMWNGELASRMDDSDALKRVMRAARGLDKPRDDAPKAETSDRHSDPHAQKLQTKIEQLERKVASLNRTSAGDRAMAEAFPLGAGSMRPSGQRGKTSGKGVDRTIDRAKEVVEAQRDLDWNRAKLASYVAGETNTQGRSVKAKQEPVKSTAPRKTLASDQKARGVSKERADLETSAWRKTHNDFKSWAYDEPTIMHGGGLMALSSIPDSELRKIAGDPLSKAFARWP